MRRAKEDLNEKRSTGNTGMESLWIAVTEILIEMQEEKRKNREREKAQERRANTETQTGIETRMTSWETSGRIDIKRERESETTDKEMKKKKDTIEARRKTVKDGGIEKRTDIRTGT